MLSKQYRSQILFFLAFLFPLMYAFYTQHIWEDFFITFRHSKNLAEGNGLTFNPGNGPIHGFTSPLGVLLPAFFYFITGKSSYLVSLWCFRVLSACAFAGAAVFLYKLAKEKAELGLAAVLVFLFFVLDIKALAFSSNGMETAFMLFFLSWSFYNLSKDASKNIVFGGLSFAGLMWTRPDGCLYIAALGITSLLFFPNKKEKFSALIKMALICTVVYLPWFVWAYWYFGSPIPQPVHAKSAVFDLGSIISGQVFSLLFTRAEMVFLPIYSQFGGWPWWLTHVIKPQIVFCLLYWALPTNDRIGRQASFCFLIFCFYLTGIYPYPWYLPAPAIFAWITLACGFDTLYHWLRSKVGQISLVNFGAVLALLLFNIGYIGWGTAQSMKVQQAEIEMGNRKEIGLWLKDNMKTDETAYMECIGYIGYFSDRNILDFPGLTTPQVAKFLKNNSEGMLGILPELKPDWVILRAKAGDDYLFGDYFNSHYEPVKVFDVKEKLDKLPPFPGRGYADLDSRFSLYHKRQN